MIALFAAIRAAHFASLLFVFGAEAFAWIPQRGGDGSALPRKSILIAAAVALITAILSLDPRTHAAMALEPLGQARIVLLAMLVAALAWRRLKGLNALLAGAALALMAVSSHAAGVAPVLGAVSDAVHLLAAGFWIGGLCVLVAFMRTRPPAATLVPALRTFSSFGMIAVALLVIAGTANGVLILGGAQGRWTGGYIGLLTLKLVLAAVMIALALTNRFGLLPGIARGEAEAQDTLSTTVAVELACGAAVLLVAGLLGMTAPLTM